MPKDPIRSHDGPRSDALAWAPWAAVGLTLLLRFAYFTQIRGNPFFDSPVMDEAYHDEWAREIAAGDLMSRAPFFRAPLYPFLLGLAYRLVGRDFALIRAAQLALGAISPWLAWKIGRRLWPARPALAAAGAFLVAADGMLSYFEADLLLESTLAPFSLALVLLVLRAIERPAVGRWAAAGLCLGLFAITRPNVLAFAPILFGVAALTRGAVGSAAGRTRIASALALTLATCAAVLPVTWMNLRAGDRVLVSWQGGLNFFLGNNAEADGWSATARSLFRVDWWGGYEDAIRLAEQAEGRELLPSEVSDHWYGRAGRWWREHPGDALALTARKAAFLVSGKEFGNNRDIRLFFREFVPMGTPFLWFFAVLAPFAVVGAVSLWRRGDPGPRVLVTYVLVYSITIVAFFVTARYRIPLRPLAALLAVEGVRVVAEGLGRRTAAGFGPAAAVVVLAVTVHGPWVATADPTPAMFYHSVASVLRARGDTARAIDWQLRACEAEPRYPEANLNLGTMYMEMGDAEKALAAFRQEAAADPDDGRNLASMAQALDRLGRAEEAERAYAAAESAGLMDAPVLYNHALLLERLDRPRDEIEAQYRWTVSVDPRFAEAWNNLGVLCAREGRLEEAVRHWEKVLEIVPGHPRATDNLRRARERLAAEDGTINGG